MIVTSFLNILSFSQVIFLCNKQSDCYIGSYCDSTSKCQDCSELKHCDALNTNCCSKDFLVQCVNNPYKCKEDNGSSNSTYETGFNSYLFLVSFTHSERSFKEFTPPLFIFLYSVIVFTYVACDLA